MIPLAGESDIWLDREKERVQSKSINFDGQNILLKHVAHNKNQSDKNEDVLLLDFCRSVWNQESIGCDNLPLASFRLTGGVDGLLGGIEVCAYPTLGDSTTLYKNSNSKKASRRFPAPSGSFLPPSYQTNPHGARMFLK